MPSLWVTYEMMEAAVPAAGEEERGPIGWNPSPRTIDAAKKYVVSSTWTGSIGMQAPRARDLGKAVQRLKQESE